MPDGIHSQSAFDDANQVPLFQEVLVELRRHPKLRDISIVMYRRAETDFRQSNMMSNPFWHWTFHDNGNYMLDFGGFRNLRSLHLLGVPLGTASEMVRVHQLVSTLLRSPNLTELSLGFSRIQYQQMFLPLLWNAYERAGGRPLALKHLYFCEGYHFAPHGLPPPPPWPPLSELSRLCNLEGIQTLAVQHNTATPHPMLRGALPLNDGPAYFPGHSLSIRRFSAQFLDFDMLRFIRDTGNNCTLPVDFLSELHFMECPYMPGMRHYLVLNENKRKYWPRAFSVEEFNGYGSRVSIMRNMIREIYEWKGLERLHLALELSVIDERVSLILFSCSVDSFPL